MLALGQKAMSGSDMIVVTSLLGLEAAGVYRLATQIVTASSASLFPIRSKFVRTYSKLLDENRTEEAKAIAGKAAKAGVTLYLIIFNVGLVTLYQASYLNDIKYREDFYLSLGILALNGLVKSAIPMIENYIIFRNKSNKGGLIQLGVIVCNVVLLFILIPLLGLPGACAAMLLSALCWRFAVRRYL
jgi:O-antigen/teichoic acid export membrane protein